ncbi:hypothetical protein QVD17_16160 [Tagetes erecta]|uniref:Alpha-1,3-mannosyl-glycoprotein 2-beta-N-acetylglucosaminyltransferase n=1 Tax=Tagetes erecta TaxID=13708 RepID=A0AAD8P0F9_TARER|nr:hypothetical protein QVD17_16160 [Tagetes erecta]
MQEKVKRQEQKCEQLRAVVQDLETDYEPVKTERPEKLIAYYNLYGIKNVDSSYSFDADDMEIAPEFFDYFDAGASLLDKDKSYAMSGIILVRIFRDKKITYWDDWFRLKENHKGQQFIRPELCSTYYFEEHVGPLEWGLVIGEEKKATMDKTELLLHQKERLLRKEVDGAEIRGSWRS